jgi:hypothetical protein
MRKDLFLDGETADRITILSIRDSIEYLQKELDDYKNGEWLHPDDVIMNQVYIEAMEQVLRYYGE